MSTYSELVFIDKSDWGAGVWTTEPDRVEWRDEATGLPCLALRNRLGAWCGYVAVPPGHRYHGLDYDSVHVDAHGGLTFADRCHVMPEHGGGICHTAQPGEPDDVWWFGFDCAHHMDVVPGMLAMDRKYGIRSSFDHGSYKTLAYVKGEVVSLARQLAEA